MGIENIKSDSVIQVEISKKNSLRHYTIIISDANIGYLCSQYPVNGRLISVQDIDNKLKVKYDPKDTIFEIVLNPNGIYPDRIRDSIGCQKYRIQLGAKTLDGKISKEEIINAVNKFQEIPIIPSYLHMTVGYVSLRLQESMESEKHISRG